MTLYILYSILALSTAILAGYYIAVFRKFPRGESIEQTTCVPVSVIVCARNEGENLRMNLPRILEQDYPNFEVVVVDDASWDTTPEVLTELQSQYRQLKVVTVTQSQKRTPGKKMALTLGFKKASTDLFLLTDADCWPKSSKWIHEMCSGFTDGFVLGYGAYEKTKGVLNKVIRFDTFTVAIQYLSAANVGLPYMGVGRNMAYSRSTYFDSGGFRKHYHLMSGDDDLMVNHNATQLNVTQRVNERSHTISRAPSSFSAWFKQKRRHMSVSQAYSRKSKIFLAIYHIAQLIFYFSIVTCFILKVSLYIPLAAFLIKTIIQLLISIRPSKVLKENGMVALLPIMEPVLLFINVVLGSLNMVRRPKVWK